MNAADAREHGASIYPHAPVEEMTVENGRITSVSVGGMVNDEISAEYVVNAAGPWAGKIGAMAGVDINMFLSRGAMTAVEYDELDVVLNRAREPSNADIVVPHDSEVILGTTSVPIDDPDDYDRDSAEIDELRTKSAELLPPVEDAPERRTWWGVRPLYAPDDGGGDGRDVSRDFFRLDHADDGVENFVSAVGGKLTTYRQMAESTSDLVAERLGVDAESTTAEQELIGADDPELLDAFVDEFSAAGIADADTVATADRLSPADD
jgi:glycerol-3-phosphate dehydrogenase